MARALFDNELVSQLVAAARGEGDAPEALGAVIAGGGSVAGLVALDALAVVEAARVLGDAALLNRVKADARDKGVRKAAGAALHKLKAAGVEVEAPAPVATWSLGTEEVELLPPVAMLGLPEDDGYFPFLMLVNSPTETVVFAGLAGAGRGHRDVDHAHLSRSQRRQVLDDARRGGLLFDVPFHVGLAFLDRAFELGGERPKGWDHLVDHVDEGVRNAARVLDPMQRQEQELDEIALHAAGALVGGEHRAVFMPDHELMLAALEETMGAITSQLELSQETRRERLSRIVNETSDRVVDGVYRRTWALALDVYAWLAAHNGWDDTRASARATALALGTGMAGHRIPFVRENTERLLAMVTEQSIASVGRAMTGPEAGGEV